MQLSIFDISFHGIEELGRNRLEASREGGHVMVVAAETPALEVANQVAASGADLILVTGSQGEMTAVAVPGWIQHQVTTVLQEHPATFHAAVTALETHYAQMQHQSPNRQAFHHEWLNEARPRLYWCQGCRCYLASPNCPKHG